MKAYHFVTAEFGLEDLRFQRLKIATIPELNDPFELLCVDLSDPVLRAAMKGWKADLGKRFGLLCFSRTWRNPVQWSHHAEKHRGLCLGFEISDKDFAREVVYDQQRSTQEAQELLTAGTTSEETILKFLTTKYAHWHYEKELRVFPQLDEKDPQKNMYFYKFSDDLKLTEVIVGAESEVTRVQISEALGSLRSSVTVRNARLAFGSYRVTTQNNAALWA